MTFYQSTIQLPGGVFKATYEDDGVSYTLRVVVTQENTAVYHWETDDMVETFRRISVWLPATESIPSDQAYLNYVPNKQIIDTLCDLGYIDLMIGEDGDTEVINGLAVVRATLLIIYLGD